MIQVISRFHAQKGGFPFLEIISKKNRMPPLKAKNRRCTKEIILVGIVGNCILVMIKVITKEAKK
jgi:hypothetical protein